MLVAHNLGRNMNFRVVVVGLGQIGMGFDFESTSKTSKLSHAGATKNHRCFTLVGGVDPDSTKRQNFESFFNVKSFSNLKNALAETEPQVVIVSTPNSYRLDILRQIIETSKPEVILIEKPIANSIDEANSIIELCSENGIMLFVNYMRTASPKMIELKRVLQSYNSSSHINGNIWYQGGLLNNGSHIVNLLEFLFGPAKNFEVFKVRNNQEFCEDNPYGVLNFRNGSLSLTPLNSTVAKSNGFHVFLEEYSLELSRELGGVILREAKKDSQFQKNYVYNEKYLSFPIKIDELQTNVLDQIALYLSGNRASLCSGDLALQTLKVLIDDKTIEEKK
jgi:hypothetical protein